MTWNEPAADSCLPAVSGVTVSDWSVPADVRDSLCLSWHPVSVYSAQRWSGHHGCRLRSSAECLSPPTGDSGVRQRSHSHSEGGQGHSGMRLGLICPLPAVLIWEGKYQKLVLIICEDVWFPFTSFRVWKWWSDIIAVITCWVRSWCCLAPVSPAGLPLSAPLLGNAASWPQAPPAASSNASWHFPAPAANTHTDTKLLLSPKFVLVLQYHHSMSWLCES